ncbi:MBL fold metallo-hydrolase [Cryptosporangium sp. NPDC051539]|uniref:MBL fold metallo-hydrolase n=1 Tax=Cryptosporangium sp. NPDC051539 TaxID=3363962 RepID=UPI0037A34E6B
MSPTAPEYGVLRTVTPIASVLLEENPGPMTLDGTNTWILRAPGERTCVVVDPGEADVEHLTRVADAGRVTLILLTHRHVHHVEGAPWLAARTGAPIRAYDPTRCRDAEPLTSTETIRASGLEIQVVHTPGHTDDSVCFRVGKAVLTGDTIVGRGTTMVTSLGDYLDTLRLLAAIPDALVLPGHGDARCDLASVAGAYLAHREERLRQVQDALTRLGPDVSASAIVDVVYAGLDAGLRGPAERSVEAQLEYLRR